MSFEAFPMSPCSGPGLCGVKYRSLWSTLENSGSTLAGSQNMIDWMLDFDWDTIPWGCTLYPIFQQAGDTTPTGGTSLQTDGGHPYSFSEYYSAYDPLTVWNASIQIMSQIWLGGPIPYFVLATGFQTPPQPNPGLRISVAGCTFQPPANSGCVVQNLVTLPLPDPDLGDYCDQYTIGFKGPHGSGSGQNYPGPWPTLASMAIDVCNNYGPNWNANQLCASGIYDPFTGEIIFD